MNLKITALLPAALLLTFFTSSCSAEHSSGTPVTYTPYFSATETSSPAASTAPEITSITEKKEEIKTDPSDIFNIIEKNYCFTTGTGDWKTKLTINEDWSFSAVYTDGNYATDGGSAPYYITEYCKFEGQFDEIKMKDSLTVEMTITTMTCFMDSEFESNFGSETVFTEIPYGMEDCEIITVYRKGTKTSSLPQNCIDWLTMSLSWGNIIPDELNCDVMYNQKAQSTFVSRLPTQS